MEQAWRHLSQENVIVTFTDTLNDGLAQLGAHTGIHFRHLRRAHNTSKRSRQSEATIALIKERNSLDIELYNRARSAFMHRLENPARLPEVDPLQVYRERVAEFQDRAAMLEDLIHGRHKLSALKKSKRNLEAAARSAQSQETMWMSVRNLLGAGRKKRQ
jgi:hypothetical protein